MKKNLFLLIMTVAMSVTAVAADTAKIPNDPKHQEMMKAWTAYATPGAPHKILADMAGNWKYTSKWWESADGKPQESKGTSSMKMILGGRFLQHDTKGLAMGMPFEGMGLVGYDNIKNKYETIWLDNMGTGVMHGTGDFDAATKTLTDSGEFSCPMKKERKSTYRGEWKVIDKNNMTYTMHGPGMTDNKEFKMMEMTYKRVK
ncbi:MAG: DUF1579 domain-containing protein [Oligoflexia bacterium]|nr:DUF1579 domain-containing protein [Oligoflexia bacterium]